MVMATRGDAEMEAAALAQMTAQPLIGLIYATINTRLVDAPARVARSAARAAELPRRQRLAAVGRARAKSAAATRRRIFSSPPATAASATSTARRSMEAARHRLRGYRQALATADLPVDPDTRARRQLAAARRATTRRER